jgi:hypothetical protein
MTFDPPSPQVSTTTTTATCDTGTNTIIFYPDDTPYLVQNCGYPFTGEIGRPGDYRVFECNELAPGADCNSDVDTSPELTGMDPGYVSDQNYTFTDPATTTPLVIGTAAIFSFSALFFIMLAVWVYFCVWFFMLYAIAWGILAVYRPILKILRYGKFN